ncbi:hypothetical protein ACDT12_13755, partial [Staphylococcus aureus]
MNPHALSGTARLPGCDVEVSASQAGSRRTSKSTFTGTPEQSPCRGQSHTLIDLRHAVGRLGVGVADLGELAPVSQNLLAPILEGCDRMLEGGAMLRRDGL